MTLRVSVEQEKIRQLSEAVEHRTVIGIALGITMERQGLTRDEAFDHLRVLSQSQNRKLYEIAAELCDAANGHESGAPGHEGPRVRSSPRS